VDDKIALRLLYLFEELNKLGTTIVIATHNEALISRFGHSQLHLESGELFVRSAPGSAGASRIGA
jgi:cell division transport system ATP-binding protein